MVELFVAERQRKVADSSGIKAKVVTIVKNPMRARIDLFARVQWHPAKHRDTSNSPR